MSTAPQLDVAELLTWAETGRLSSLFGLARNVSAVVVHLGDEPANRSSLATGHGRPSSLVQLGQPGAIAQDVDDPTEERARVDAVEGAVVV